MGKKTLWETYTPEQKDAMTAFCEDYKEFMSTCKTERECVTSIIAEAEALGYVDLNTAIANGTKLTPGSKVYANNRGKMLMLVQIGEGTFIKNMNILGGHIDSPHGRISVEWKREADGIHADFVIPQGVTATFKGNTLKTGESSFIL